MRAGTLKCAIKSLINDINQLIQNLVTSKYEKTFKNTLSSTAVFKNVNGNLFNTNVICCNIY